MSWTVVDTGGTAGDGGGAGGGAGTGAGAGGFDDGGGGLSDPPPPPQPVRPANNAVTIALRATLEKLLMGSFLIDYVRD
jgi:hypothetical protein